MSDKMMGLIASRFRTLGEPLRLRLLQQLETGEKTVGELVEAVDGNQPNVSKHLSILFDAGLVSRRREGNSVLYGIGDPMVFKLCALVCRRETRRSEEVYTALRGAGKGRGVEGGKVRR